MFSAVALFQNILTSADMFSKPMTFLTTRIIRLKTRVVGDGW